MTSGKSSNAVQAVRRTSCVLGLQGCVPRTFLGRQSPRSVARVVRRSKYMEAFGMLVATFEQAPNWGREKRSNGGRQLCVDAVKGVAAAAGRMSEAEEVERLKKDLDKCNSIIKVSVCARARARACVCVRERILGIPLSRAHT